MSKYRLPILATSYLEVEADSLEQAMSNVYEGTKSIRGIDVDEVEEWGVDHWQPFYKDGEEVKSDGQSVFIGEVANTSSI